VVKRNGGGEGEGDGDINKREGESWQMMIQRSEDASEY